MISTSASERDQMMLKEAASVWNKLKARELIPEELSYGKDLIERSEKSSYMVLLDLKTLELQLQLWFGCFIDDDYYGFWLGFGSSVGSGLQRLINTPNHPMLGFSYFYKQDVEDAEIYADFKAYPRSFYQLPIYEKSQDWGEWVGIYQTKDDDLFWNVALDYVEQALIAWEHIDLEHYDLDDLTARALESAEQSTEAISGGVQMSERTYQGVDP